MHLVAHLLDRARAQIDFARVAPASEKGGFIVRARALLEEARAEVGRQGIPVPPVSIDFLNTRGSVEHLYEDLAALEATVSRATGRPTDPVQRD